jgi:membrane associated rhomboid family serine protease
VKPLQTNEKAILILIVWFLEQIVAGTIDRLLAQTPGGVAWWAHVGGFVGGFALAPILRRL